MSTLPDIDLGLAGARSGTRVAVAMSGGVDSAVTAALVARAGYDVVGITLQLYDHGEATRWVGACCAGQDIHDARRVTDRLGIPHYVLDYERRFREAVIDDFADSYLAGETPIPCVRCNQRVKFRDLLETARDLGAAALATGHYVQRLEGAAGAELHRAVDAGRDQSYFLFATTPDQLAFLRFPLGGLDKRETRGLADAIDLPVAAKPDSQDICFVPSGSYMSVIERLRPGAADPGEIVDLEGNVLGRHAGVFGFTVGQRRGLGVPSPTGEPLYVVRLDPGAARVVVGPKTALATAAIVLGDVNWIGPVPASPIRAEVKVRSAQAPLAAMVHPLADGRARVVFDQPEHGVAPGQACVFYDGTRVLGGGWIRRETADSRRADFFAASA